MRKTPLLVKRGSFSHFVNSFWERRSRFCLPNGLLKKLFPLERGNDQLFSLPKRKKVAKKKLASRTLDRLVSLESAYRESREALRKSLRERRTVCLSLSAIRSTVCAQKPCLRRGATRRIAEIPSVLFSPQWALAKMNCCYFPHLVGIKSASGGVAVPSAHQKKIFPYLPKV